MNLNNQGNNQRDAVNVNTRSIPFKNANGLCPSALLVGFWNDMLSIKVHPALEKEKQTETQTFDWNQVVNTAITLEKASVLIEKLENDIIPATVNGTESIFRGVLIGGDSLIGVGVRVENDTRTAFFAVHKNIDPDTKRPKLSIAYDFKTSTTYDDYDPETGAYRTSKNIQGELLLFLSILKAARTAMSNAAAHATRTVDKFYRDRMMNTINEIATKLGVSNGGGGNGYGNRYSNKQDVFGGGGGARGNSAPMPKEELPDFDAPMGSLQNFNDIDQFMN